MTAAVVARQRWQEREQAMGGPLDELLPRMDVEIALLEDDGTVGEREPAFIDRVFKARSTASRTSARARGATCCPTPRSRRVKGRASRAYRKLFVDDGLPAESFERSELRLYRLLVRTIAVSPAAEAQARRRCPT